MVVVASFFVAGGGFVFIHQGHCWCLLCLHSLLAVNVVASFFVGDGGCFVFIYCLCWRFCWHCQSLLCSSLAAATSLIVVSSAHFVFDFHWQWHARLHSLLLVSALFLSVISIAVFVFVCRYQ